MYTSKTKAIDGKALKDIRQIKKVSQSELAKALGYKNHQSISNIERGRQNYVSDEIMKKLRNFFNVEEAFFDPHRTLTGKAQIHEDRLAILRFIDRIDSNEILESDEQYLEKILSAINIQPDLMNEILKKIHEEKK